MGRALQLVSIACKTIVGHMMQRILGYVRDLVVSVLGDELRHCLTTVNAKVDSINDELQLIRKLIDANQENLKEITISLNMLVTGKTVPGNGCTSNECTHKLTATNSVFPSSMPPPPPPPPPPTRNSSTEYQTKLLKISDKAISKQDKSTRRTSSVPTLHQITTMRAKLKKVS